MHDLRDIDVYVGKDELRAARVRSMMKDWRSAMRRGDYEEADDIARDISRAADRLGPHDVHIIRQPEHRNPRS
jgi:hypothetical protein